MSKVHRTDQIKAKARIFTVEDWSSEPLEVDCGMVDTSEIIIMNCFYCPKDKIRQTTACERVTGPSG